MDIRAELAERGNKLSEVQRLRNRVERQGDLYRLRPFAEESNVAETLLIAGAYHDLISKGVPREFSARGLGEYVAFKTMQPPYTTASFPDYPPEIMLDGILKGLIYLEELYRDEIQQLKGARRWWGNWPRRQ